MGTSNLEDYTDKTVIVTGACGGIGSVTAEAFAQAGARLGLCDIRQDKLGATGKKFRKAGVNAFCSAIDLAKYRIRVNAISPGSVDTPLLHAAVDQATKQFNRTADEQRQVWESQYPTQRFTSPQEIANLALFLCSDRAANITGANFVVDGGITVLLPNR